MTWAADQGPEVKYLFFYSTWEKFTLLGNALGNTVLEGVSQQRPEAFRQQLRNGIFGTMMM